MQRSVNMKIKNEIIQKVLLLFLVAIAMTLSKLGVHDVFMYLVGMVAGGVLVKFSDY